MPATGSNSSGSASSFFAQQVKQVPPKDLEGQASRLLIRKQPHCQSHLAFYSQWLSLHSPRMPLECVVCVLGYRSCMEILIAQLTQCPFSKAKHWIQAKKKAKLNKTCVTSISASDNSVQLYHRFQSKIKDWSTARNHVKTLKLVSRISHVYIFQTNRNKFFLWLQKKYSTPTGEFLISIVLSNKVLSTGGRFITNTVFLFFPFESLQKGTTRIRWLVIIISSVCNFFLQVDRKNDCFSFLFCCKPVSLLWGQFNTETQPSKVMPRLWGK